MKTIFQAFDRKYLDLSLRSGRNYTVRIVERPGQWMTDAAIASLSRDIKTVAGRTLNAGDLSYGVFAADPSCMTRVIITIVYRLDKTPVAFNALSVMHLETVPEPTDVLHLGLVMVDPEERSQNLSWVLYGLTCFLIFVRRQFRPIWISNVTQVPAVVGMVSQMFSNVWPQPNAERRALRHLMLARLIMTHHRDVFGVGPEAVFDEEHFVIKNAYTGGSDGLKKTWEDVPKHRDPAFNNYCDETLDYERGDDVIQLGKMDIKAMRGFLSREVPRSAVGGLVLAGALVAFQCLLLPFVYWADASRAWSILRPAKGRKS